MTPYRGLTEDAYDRLIVVDLQNQFITSETEKLVPAIEALIPHFKRVVISQIEHDPEQYVYRLKNGHPRPLDPRGINVRSTWKASPRKKSTSLANAFSPR